MKKQEVEHKGKIPVLITTDNTKRGVFMGFIDPKDKEQENIEASEVRMAVYWSRGVKGVIGLAVTGPLKDCRISPAAPKAMIKGVTAVLEITDDALKAWRSEPWQA